MSTTQHFLDIRQSAPSEPPADSAEAGTDAAFSYTCTAGTCTRTYATPATPSAPHHLQSEPSPGTWSKWSSYLPRSEMHSATSTAQLSGFYTDETTKGAVETERGQAFDAASGRLREYEEVWGRVEKMVMVPEEGRGLWVLC